MQLHLVAPLWQKWVSDGTAKGLDRASLLQDFYSTMKRYGVEKPTYGYTP